MCDLNDIEESIKFMIEMDSHTYANLVDTTMFDHLAGENGNTISGIEYDTIVFNFSLGNMLDEPLEREENFLLIMSYGMNMMKMVSSE